MEKHTIKADNQFRSVFNECINIMGQLDRGEKNEFSNKNPMLLFEMASVVGAFGSWIKYEKETTYHRIIINNIETYITGIYDAQMSDIEFVHAALEVFERNIASGILTPNVIISKLDKANRSTMLELLQVIQNANCGKNYYVPFIDSYFTRIYAYPKLYEKKSNEVFKLTPEEIKDEKQFIESHRIIKAYYLDKKETFTEEDIIYIIKALKDLDVSEESLKRVKKGLECILYRRNSKLEKEEKRNKILSVVIPKAQLPKKEYLSKKEYNNIRRELLSYYDIETHIPLRILTIKEIIYCIRLMVRLNLPEQEIDKFLRIIDKENKKMENPISLYIALYDKISHYKKELSLSKKITLVEEYLQQIFICNDEDYEFWKESIKEELASILNIIPNDGEYEKEESKKLVY